MIAPTSSGSALQSNSSDKFSPMPEWPLSNTTMTTQPPTATVMAQFDSDVLGDIGGAFKNFYDSGQLWALIIGMVLGYVVRGITTYK